MFKENVFVISKIPFKEANFIVILFSKNLGKVKTNIYSATKPNSKSFFPYDVGDLIEIVFIEKNSEWIQIKEHRQQKQKTQFHLLRYLFLNLYLEFLVRYDIEYAENQYFFEIIQGIQNRQWGQYKNDIIFIFIHLVELSQRLGHELHIYHCLNCQTKAINIGETIKLNKLSYRFDFTRNGLICSRCSSEEHFIPSWFLKLYYLAISKEELQSSIDSLFYVQAVNMTLEYLVGCLNLKLKSISIFLRELNKNKNESHPSTLT